MVRWCINDLFLSKNKNNKYIILIVFLFCQKEGKISYEM